MPRTCLKDDERWCSLDALKNSAAGTARKTVVHACRGSDIWHKLPSGPESG
jgi:hypothetical protein